MKTITFLAFLCLLTISIYSQKNHKFNYEIKEKYDAYIVTPNFDQLKVEGKRGIPSFLDECYLSNMFYTIIKGIVPKEKLSVFHKGSTLFITFNIKGEILYCWFVILIKDKNVLSENDLYNIYIKFKQTNIDMTKLRIDPPNYTKDVSLFQYAEISIPLIPKECK